MEVNLSGVQDERLRAELNIRLSGVDAAVARADWVTAEVREEIKP
ncbi:hypothetical protein AB0J43_58540 [Nonomuraea fuscirosea]